MSFYVNTLFFFLREPERNFDFGLDIRPFLCNYFFYIISNLNERETPSMRSKMLPFIAIAVIAGFICGCDGEGGYKNDTAKAMYLFRYGKYREAAEELKGRSEAEGKNQLLLLCERGMFLHTAKDYKESTAVLLKASQMLDKLDVVSIHESVFSVVADDRFKTYRGEDFEKVLINTFLAINFLMQNNYEEAMVEFRQADQKLELVKRKYGEKRLYVENAFTRYLMALCYEALGQDNDAYIEYKRVHELMPKFPYLASDLIRHATALGFNDELANWKKEYGNVAVPAKNPNEGELIIIFECGLAPEKFNNNGALPYPQYEKRLFKTVAADISAGVNKFGSTQKLYDVEDVSERDLKQRISYLIAKRIGAKIIREGAAYYVERKTGSKELAWGIRILSNLGEGADLRSWLSLPASLQIMRAKLPQGKHEIKMEFRDRFGRVSKKPHIIKDVVINPGKKTFVLFRTIDD